MESRQIDDILNNLRRGKKWYWEVEDQELSTLIAIEQHHRDIYSYTHSTSHRYDVSSAARYEQRLVNEEELRALLRALTGDAGITITYVDKEIVNQNTREKLDLIHSCLRQRPRVVYVVLKEDTRGASERANIMNFNSLFQNREQAEQMLEYLRTKQGAACSLKEITLTLNGEELELHADLSPLERVNSRQVLVTLLAMDTAKIASFFNE